MDYEYGVTYAGVGHEPLDIFYLVRFSCVDALPRIYMQKVRQDEEIHVGCAVHSAAATRRDLLLLSSLTRPLGATTFL